MKSLQNLHINRIGNFKLKTNEQYIQIIEQTGNTYNQKKRKLFALFWIILPVWSMI